MEGLGEILNSKFANGVSTILAVLVGTYIRSYVDDRIASKLKPLIDQISALQKDVEKFLQRGAVIEDRQTDHVKRIERLEERAL